MKIAILTQPLRYNYGGILQNFALQTVLRRMGHDVVTLDPRRYKYTWSQYIVLFFRHLVSRYIKGHREVALRGEWLADKPTRILGTNTFRFIDKYIKRREYTDLLKEVKEGDFDAFIIGSDQVWRPEYNGNLPNMFLDFTEGWNVKRIAYAASFGVDTWNESEKKTRCCKELLQRFDLVSVREDSGVHLCKDVFNVDAINVLDPTLLLTKEDYISLLKLDKIPESKGNLLVYILDYTDNKRNLIDFLAKQYSLTPFRVNSDYEDRSADINKRVQPPVEQWVRGFYDAKYVITDSFHACVFSIIFGKPFVVYGNNERGFGRFRSLLRRLALEQCLITNSSEFCGFSNDNLETIALLQDEMRSSNKLLRDYLSFCNNE